MRARLMAMSPAAAACFSLLALTTTALYAQLLTFDFVHYDDLFFVVENARVQGGFSPESVYWAFTSGSLANWHPLTWFSHMLDVEFYGLDPSGHHATALGLHVANTLLFFVILRAMTGATWRSAAVAGLFSLHPLHVESVAWVSARGNILSSFLGLVALGSYVAYARGTTTLRPMVALRIQTYGIVLVFFALSLMAKPMWIALPFVLLLLDYWPLGRVQGGPAAARTAEGTSCPGLRLSPSQLVKEKIPLFAIGLVSMVITYATQTASGSAVNQGSVPLVFRFANVVVSYVQYLGKTLWPADLSPLYPHPFVQGSGAVPWTTLQAVGSLALVVAITLLVLRLRDRRPYALVGWLWFVGTLVPVIGFVQIGVHTIADRYTYIPLVGIFIAFVWGAGEVAERTGRAGRAAVVTALALVIAVLGAVSYSQSQHWQNSYTLSSRAIDVTPNSPSMLVSLAADLVERGDEAGALELYQRALEVSPDYAPIHTGLGQFHQNRGEATKAIAHFQIALESNPANSYFRYKLGVAFAEYGQIDEALGMFEVALEELAERPMDPHPAELHLMIGNALHLQGNVGKAAQNYRRGLELAPERSAEFRHWIERAEREQRLAARPPRLARRKALESAVSASFTARPMSGFGLPGRVAAPAIPASAGPARF